MSDDQATFFDLYARGEALAEEIDDYVDEWHDAPPGAAASEVPLHEFLGLRWDEYAAWVEDSGVLPRVLMARLQGVPLSTALAANDDRDFRMAARATDSESRAALTALIRQRGNR